MTRQMKYKDAKQNSKLKKYRKKSQLLEANP
jgi:hypothetical protein